MNTALQIREWLANAEKEIAEIEVRIKPELEKIDNLKKKITLYHELLKIEEPRSVEEVFKQGKLRRRLFHQKPSGISDLAVKILRNTGKAMHYTEIMEKIKIEGVDIPGKDPKANMTAHLSNDNRVERAEERGYYKLKEWGEKEAVSE